MVVSRGFSCSSARLLTRGEHVGNRFTRAGSLAEDLGFWVAQANSTESEVTSFEKACDDIPFLRFTSELQIAASAAQRAAAVFNDAPAGDLSPMAAMLDSLYEESKKKIVELNQKEEKSKRLYGAREAAHDARLKALGDEFQKHHAPAALKASDSALEAHLEDEENFFMKYWKRVRDRNHKQFHTFLKIQHGLMSRLKSMSDMVKQAAAGKALQQPLPEVAFLQGYRAKQAENIAFARSSLADVAAARAELAQWD